MYRETSRVMKNWMEARKANRISYSKVQLLVRVWMDKNDLCSVSWHGEDGIRAAHRSRESARTAEAGGEAEAYLPPASLWGSDLCKSYLSRNGALLRSNSWLTNSTNKGLCSHGSPCCTRSRAEGQPAAAAIFQRAEKHAPLPPV